MLRRMDDLDREIARIEAAERRNERAWRRVDAEIAGGPLSRTFAGSWLRGDQESLVVAFTTEVEAAAAQLRAAVPDAPLEVVQRPRTLRALEELEAEVVEAASRLAQEISYTGIDLDDSVVEAMLEDLENAATQSLQRQFDGRPVRWSEGIVVAAVGEAVPSSRDR